jgi:hypothetical protein
MQAAFGKGQCEMQVTGWNEMQVTGLQVTGWKENKETNKLQLTSSIIHL